MLFTFPITFVLTFLSLSWCFQHVRHWSVWHCSLLPPITFGFTQWRTGVGWSKWESAGAGGVAVPAIQLSSISILYLWGSSLELYRSVGIITRAIQICDDHHKSYTDLRGSSLELYRSVGIIITMEIVPYQCSYQGAYCSVKWDQ